MTNVEKFITISVMDVKRRLKNRVKELRNRLKLRQADLADQTGVTRQTILAIEKGRLNPSINIALRIAQVVREPVEHVFYLDRNTDELPSEPVEQPRRAPQTVGNPPAFWDFS